MVGYTLKAESVDSIEVTGYATVLLNSHQGGVCEVHYLYIRLVGVRVHESPGADTWIQGFGKGGSG